MFGRANFDLLRLRARHQAWPATPRGIIESVSEPWNWPDFAPNSSRNSPTGSGTAPSIRTTNSDLASTSTAWSTRQHGRSLGMHILLATREHNHANLDRVHKRAGGLEGLRLVLLIMGLVLLIMGCWGQTVAGGGWSASRRCRSVTPQISTGRIPTLPRYSVQPGIGQATCSSSSSAPHACRIFSVSDSDRSSA